MTVSCAKSFLLPPSPFFHYVTWLELVDLPASPSQAMGFKARTTICLETCIPKTILRIVCYLENLVTVINPSGDFLILYLKVSVCL